MALNVRIPTYVIWAYSNFEITAMTYPVFWFTYIPIIFDLFLYLLIYIYLDIHIYVYIYTHIHIHMASLVVQTVMNLPAMLETQFDPWVRKIPWRRKQQVISVFLPGKFHGERSLVGYRPWSHKKLDMTEWLTLSLLYIYFKIWSILNSPLKTIAGCLPVI